MTKLLLCLALAQAVGHANPFFALCHDTHDAKKRTLKQQAELLEKATTDMDLTLDEPCPECGKPLAVRRSRHGAFLGCSGYPDCRYTRALDQTRREPSDEVCEKCQRPMFIITGKKGRSA